jgi:CRP-like cAMP-binding protein
MDDPKTDLRLLLSRVSFLRELTPDELERVLAIARVVPYARDAVLFKEGDPGAALYIVVDGTVRVSKVVPGAKEEPMAFLERGGCFGEMALIDEFPRSADAIAQTDCRVLFFDKDRLLDLLQEDPAIARKILWAFCRTLSMRLREATDRIVGLFTLARPS